MVSCVLLLGLAACGSDGGSSDDGCGIATATIQKWALAPTLPADVVSTDTADLTSTECAYYGFAWQEFLYLTQTNSGGEPEFEKWTSKEELFLGRESDDGIPAGGLAKGRGVPADDTLLAASDVPLVDLNGRDLQFSVLLNEAEAMRIRECELDRKGCYNTLVTDSVSPPAPVLPAGSVELKAAWRRSQSCNADDASDACRRVRERFFVTKINVSGESTWAEMVGMHIIQKTPTNPSWVWATFEHVDNAPDCDDLLPANHGRPWGFYRGETECDVRAGNADLNNCTANAYCAPCPDLLEPGSDSVPTLTADQPCTTSPHLYTAVEGATCDRAPYAGQVCRTVPVDSSLVAPLNARVADSLRNLGGSHAVWANYELVGVLWADAELEESGTIGLSNTTMETYLQDLYQPASDDSVFDATARSGCRVCHSFPNSQTSDQPGASVNGPILDYSFVFYALRSDQADPAECSPEQPLPICTAD